MPTFFPAPVTFDVDAADLLVWEAFRKGGFTHINSRFGEQISTDKVGIRLAEIFKTQHTVRDRRHLKADPDRAAWREDIAEEFFGDEPLLHTARSAEEEAARDCMVHKVWEYCGPSLTSPLNTALSEVDGYVLLQAKVAKKRPRAGMKGVPVPEIARFLTRDADLIMEYAINGSALMSWRRATERLESTLREIGNRQPELRLRIAEAVSKELPSVTGLLVHADVKAITAMQPNTASDTSADPDGEAR
jgi:hypothetical protein